MPLLAVAGVLVALAIRYLPGTGGHSPADRFSAKHGVRPLSDRRRLLVTPLLGMAIGELAIAYAQGTGKSSSEVLFSGQTALPPLVEHAGGYTVGAPGH